MASYPNFSIIHEGEFQFPSRDVAETDKELPKYSLEYSRAIFSRYVNDKAGVLYSRRSDLDLIRQYGKGEQPISIYKNWYQEKSASSSDDSVLSTSNTEKTRQGWENISTRVISPLPRVRTIIKGYLDQVGQDIFVDAIDPLSNDMKDNMKWKMFTVAQNYEFIKEFHMEAGVPLEELEFLPANVTELNLYEAMGGFKMNYARSMEKIIKHTERISEVDDRLKDEWVDDAVDIGHIAARVVYDDVIRKYKYRYMDPRHLVIQYVKDDDYSRSEWAGYVEQYTISELKQLMPDVEEEFFRNIAYAYQKKCGNPTYNDATWDNYSKHSRSGIYQYNNFVVEVFESEWIDYEASRHLIYTSKNGHKSVKPLGKYSEVNLTENQKKRGSKDKKTKIRKLRGAKWVIGTDVVFDTGMVNMTDRPKRTDVMHSFRLYTLSDLPITEQLIPIADDMALAWYRWQDDRNQLQRAGYSVDVGMMENIQSGGKTFEFTHVLEAWRNTRYLFHQQSLSGKYEGGGISPVQPIPSMVMDALTEFITTWEAALKRIEDVTGINLVMLGASAPSGSQVTTTQMSAASAIHVLKPIINTVGRLKNDLAETTIRRLQLAFKVRPDIAKGYVDVVGEADVELLKQAEKDAVQYGMEFVNKPTEEMKQSIIGAAQASLEARRQGMPGISIAEFTYIAQQLDARGNIKELSALLDFLNMKSEERVQANKERDIQMQGQQNQQLAQSQEQSEQGKDQRQTQRESMLEDKKTEREVMLKRMDRVGGDANTSPNIPQPPV